MQGPLFIPNHLIRYQSNATDEELLQALKQRLDDLILFFEYACEDETWALRHSKFIRLVLRWATKQFYLGNLSFYYTHCLVKIIQSHYSFLHLFLFFRPALFFTVKMQLGKQVILVNSLLFGIGSPTLGRVFKRECFEKLNDEWILHHVKISTFRLIENYLYTGQSPDLWRYDYDTIMDLMVQAQAWEIRRLVKDCASHLRRYIHQDNVVGIILKAHQQGFEDWKEEAYAFFNKQGWGLQLISGNFSELKIEFLNFQLETLKLFDLFSPWVTHLVFRDRLSEESEYQISIRLCRDLVGVDLSQSHAYANQFAALPPYLLDLALSDCIWISPNHLRIAAFQCHHIKRLELANNRHLNYLAWGELHRFKQLKELNLAHCLQLANEDLKLIGQGCPLLSNLNIEECRKINDEGIAVLVVHCPYLQDLNLSYCDQLSDRALIEIGLHLLQLRTLKLMNCEGFTDKGLEQIVKLRPTLTSLHVQGCHFSLEVLNSIQKIFPLLNLSYI